MLEYGRDIVYVLAMKNTVTVSFTVDPDIRDRFDAVATRSRLTRSWLLTTIMLEWLEANEKARIVPMTYQRGDDSDSLTIRVEGGLPEEAIVYGKPGAPKSAR